MSLADAALLVVDDNEDNRYTLTRRLKREGYANLTTANDGKHALELLRSKPFDLVLLDITMPEMNGYQVLEHLKADAELRNLPVIMISAVEEIESVVRCIELGAEDYLHKPFDATLLRARVGASLEKKRLRDEILDWNKKLEKRVQEQVAQLEESMARQQLIQREEARILALSQDLAGELNLDVLFSRIMHATTELLDADRSTLFLYDRKSGELFSRVAEGVTTKEIRFPGIAGVAGAVFTSSKTENIADPYGDPRFNKDVDRLTGYRTESMLTMPIVNKAGACIGVTQVLNKRGGKFSGKDESRLGAFTAQITVALENARLFEDVLHEKNYNDNILRSTSDGIVTLDAREIILTANDAALRIFGHSREEIVGRPARDIFRDHDAWVLRSIDKVRNAGNREIAVGAELKLDKKNPTSVNLAVNPLLDAEGEHIGSMIVLEDITSEKRMKSTMSRYMSPAVAEQLLAGGESVLGGKGQQVSILFSDVRDFTTISEALGARETVSMLNQYFERMVDVVLTNHGVLDKFIGDAIMALFGVPFNSERDADAAVKAANGMIVALRALNIQRVAGRTDPIDIGVGISTGTVIVGNIGSPKRMEYTVIGDSVNLASRLEGVTKIYGCKVLISEATRLELREKHLLRAIDLLRVKGKTEPIAIYEAMDHFTEESFPNLERSVAQFNDGIINYRAQKWNDAIACFNAALRLHPGDKPGRVMLARSERFRAEPPPADWDGVWIMTEK